ncbi:hypothetical protein CLNEO_00520 [Anaerotignum neopropionicum]|uniref:Uncharacterized protein n=1 Tax=Anaerotignum neopropionicum TaxID=36847 RepID=A0A136WHJ9_9FIRM|nr:hypothetical protein [Anaerotignum neopropionicum]KXL53957.1 hypothetical protein CLNEO_00520 [Anaerotignum neopropionicum]
MKKSGFIAVVAFMMLAFGGCGTSANNLGATRDDLGFDYDYANYGYDTDGTAYSNGYNAGTYTGSGAAYWDGYGINSGRPITTGDTLGNPYGNDVNSLTNMSRDVGIGVRNGLNNTTATVAG